jgi:hypothetical protein
MKMAPTFWGRQPDIDMPAESAVQALLVLESSRKPRGPVKPRATERSDVGIPEPEI